MSETLLVKNARVWPSAFAEIIENGQVLIENQRIRAIGANLNQKADRVIDAKGALCMPGLIQTHIHMCQTLFRGMAEDIPLLPWLKNYIWPLEAAHTPESLAASALLSSAELIRSGTTAFMTMETVRHTAATLDAVSETGLMGVVCHCFMDASAGYDPLAVPLEDGLAYCDTLRAAYKDHDRLRVGISPRFTLSCTTENMRTAVAYARQYQLLLHTHAAEQVEEVNLVRAKTGLPNVEYLHSVGLTGEDVGLAHCVHIENHERNLMKESGTSVLHCPSANFKLGSGIAPIPEYMKMGINVSLGADGAPCNNRLDAFLEMREAGLMQKPRLGADAMPARDVVKLATENGAKTLGWEKEMGTLEVGKRANLILIDQDTVHVVPSTNPAANVVYTNISSDVKLTMVNGQVLYQDGEFKTIDEEKLKSTVRKERKKLVERAGIN